VYEMRVGLSWPGCRTRPQTAGKLQWSRAIVVSVSGKGTARSCQVGAGKTNVSEPSMKCRNSKAMSKPGSGGCPGTSAGETCLLPAWHPALRRRESGTGSYTEPWNLSSRCQGNGPSGGPTRTGVPTRGTGAERLVVALKRSNVRGAKGPCHQLSAIGSTAQAGGIRG
jgi:hypothetical protein